MEDYYPLLMEFSIEFKRFSRKYLADLKNQAYKENDSARVALVAEGYVLQRNQIDGKIYCLKTG